MRVPIAPPPEADLDFVSGPRRQDGMGVRFFLLDDAVEGVWAASARLEGWPGLAHGTAFAALHDEAAIYALAYLAMESGFTKRLDVRFLRPLRLGQEVRVRCSVAKQDARSATMASQLLLPDGKVASTAETEYAYTDALSLERMLGKPLSPYLAAWLAADKPKRLELALARSREVLGP
jgi:acyl-CoA thioesterase FadM